MNLIQDDRAQVGGLIVVVAGLLIVGFLYVGFSIVMSEIQTANNALIADTSLHYSQDHWNAMDLMFRFWWAVPVLSVILFVIYGIINALRKQAGLI